MSSPVEGVVSGVSHAGLALIINTLFSTILGRRLGTVDDGTSLRSNSHIGVGVDLDDSTSEHFTANTRDVTLKRQHTILTIIFKLFKKYISIDISYYNIK